jgi:predicted MFS family arabinose efflux permease
LRRPIARPDSATIAVGAYFFVNGATYSSWVPRLPEIRADLDVSDTALGLTLLGGGLGGLVMSAVSGRIVDRFGSRITTVATSVVLSALLPLVAFAPAPAVLFVTLLTIGAFDGITDVAMNTQALQLQGLRPRSILNRMHAVWSIGTLTGALIASRAAAAGVSLESQLIVTSVVLVVLACSAFHYLLAPVPVAPQHVDDDGRRIRLPRRLVAGLFGLGMLAILAELPATEWASLLMEERFDLSIGSAGFGFVGFAAGMVVGRLGADLVVDHFGPEHARRGGATVAAIGLTLACIGWAPWVSVLGFFVAGCGASTLFPMLMRLGNDLVPGARGVAIAAAGTRLGILLASPLMGAISDATSRSIALATIAVTAATLTALVPPPRGVPGVQGTVTPPDAHVTATTVTPRH